MLVRLKEDQTTGLVFGEWNQIIPGKTRSSWFYLEIDKVISNLHWLVEIQSSVAILKKVLHLVY